MGWRLPFVVLASAIFCSGAGFAASEKPKADAPAKPTPPPVSSDPQLTTATFGDWIERCQRINANGENRRVCEVSVTVVAQGQNSPLAQVAIGRLKKADPLRVTLVLPVNVAFPSAPKIDIGDAGDPTEFAWRQCVPAGCFAEAPFSEDAQHAWRSAKAAKVESKIANGQALNFPISLRGLPQALDALAKEP